MAQVAKCQADSQAACGGITGCRWVDMFSAAFGGAVGKALSTNAGDDKSTSPAAGMCWPENLPATSMNVMVSGACARQELESRPPGGQQHVMAHSNSSRSSS